MAFVEGFSLEKAVFPFSRGKNRISQGAENRGSLISVPLAPRVVTVVSKLITDRNFFWGELISNCRYRIALPEELISVTETDLWEFQQKISHYRYRFSLEFQSISITDTDFGLKTN